MIEEGGLSLRRHDGPIRVLAHRGGSGPWRENTLEAFAGALRLGADGVELDVRRTSDGTLVVHHDAEIAGVGAIHALPGRALPPWIPRLEDALGRCAGAIVDVEIKNAPVEPGFDPGESAATEVADLLAATTTADGGPAHVIVSSFWPASLAAVHVVAPEIPIGLLVHPALDVTAAAREAALMGCSALLPFHTQVTPGLVELAHGLDMAVAVWTVNEPAPLAAVVAAGVDVVISDRVTDTLEALARSPER